VQAGANFIIAVTGASGAVYASQMLGLLLADQRVGRVFLVISNSGLRVLAEELGLKGRADVLRVLVREDADRVTLLANEDIGAAIASGSFPVSAMIVVPCSMGTLAAVAHGLADNLIERAADVCLKERRRLVLCVRETPLHLIHLRNMTAVTEAGAIVYPVIPTHYNHPQSIEEIARNYCQRVLATAGLPQPDAYVWSGKDLL
jgi:flavin prenyltransferase